MFKVIVVPLDGSELSEKALPYALRFAKTLDLNLTLLRVVEIPDFPGDPLQKQHLQEAAKYLTGIKNWLLSDQESLKFSNQLDICVLLGDPADEICRYVREEELALLVMTTHGRSGLSRVLTGSVTGKVLHKLHNPILLVRPFGQMTNQTLPELLEAQDEPYANTFLENGIRILMPLDQSEKAETALEPAFELARKFNAPLYLLKVNSPLEPVTYTDAVTLAFSPEELIRREGQEREAARAYLGQIAQSAQKEGVETVIEALTGNPAEEIMRYANLVDPDLIIMATHARGELGRLIFGSVANRVLQTSHLPVLMVPSGKSGSKPGSVKTLRQLRKTGKEPGLHKA
jgi:nucleotide-binding universal stress UspA family protein